MNFMRLYDEAGPKGGAILGGEITSLEGWTDFSYIFRLDFKWFNSGS